MADCGMPWAVLNMGSEMLYILEQRLSAQQISEEKGARVLADVIATMFSEKFLSELFKPQRLYSAAATRAIFDQLAHSSIMRLNASSMDKLYDLMSMAAKSQLLCVASPYDVPTVANNHIETLKKLNLSTDSKKCIDRAQQQLMQLYATFEYADYFSMRQQLARFYQDKRVKVSLFLQEGLQLADGNICITTSGPLPVNVEMPGKITYYESGAVVRTETLKLGNAVNVRERTATDRCELGYNLYAKDKRRKAREAALSGTEVVAVRRLDRGRDEYDSRLDEEDKQGARDELNVLASLIAPSQSGKDDHWNIDQLFPGLSGDTDKSTDDVLVFDSEDKEARMKWLEKAMGELDVSGANNEEDLLDLMDRAGK